MNNLNNLLKVLLQNEIDFVLIGGFAGVVYGSTQVTRDLDICAMITPAQVEKLRSALKDLHPHHRMNPNFKPSFLTEPKDLANLQNIYLETDLGVLDIISEVTEVGDFEQVKKNSVEIEIFGHKCKVISIDALIKAKEKMGRPKDKIVVAELKALRQRSSLSQA
ncbi:MAG: nucleotidyltransferase [Calothrix sp. SM1_5_4]|nr:nucleotidyltransferase [Calothrix sp. SM1_5_4]